MFTFRFDKQNDDEPHCKFVLLDQQQKTDHIDCGEGFLRDCQTRKDFRVQSKHPQLFSKLSVKSASRVVFEFLPYTAKKRAHLWSQISDPRPILWTSWGEQWVLFVCHRCKWGRRRRLWKCRTLFACIATSVLPEAQCRNCENLLSPFFRKKLREINDFITNT